MATEHDGRRRLRRLVAAFETVVAIAMQPLAGHSYWDRHATGARKVQDRRRDRGNGVAPEQLMTPEERVVRLVLRNDGKMKQAEIVAALSWSESTVSRKLSRLESEGAIRRYRIGREKLVFLPGHEPAALESPLARAAAD